jgi:hypothetical protein
MRAPFAKRFFKKNVIALFLCVDHPSPSGGAEVATDRNSGSFDPCLNDDTA